MENRIGPETRARIEDAWPVILERLAAGELVRDIMRDLKVSDGMKRAYLASAPNARTEWNTAREASADAFLDEVLATANSKPDDAAHARTKIDALKWAARIRNPRLYGDRAQLDVLHSHVDLTAIIRDANARLAAQRTLAPVIEGVAVRVMPERLSDLL